MNLDLNKKEFWEEFFGEFCNECRELYAHKGFNYDIPQEGQLRSALYSFLKKDYSIEIETDIFSRKTGNLKVVGKYDLRAITPQHDIVIELKRATALTIWNNDYSGFLKSWKKDIQKLKWLNKGEYVLRFINKNNKKIFILITFWDSEKHNKSLKERIDRFKEDVQKDFKLIELEEQKLYDKDKGIGLYTIYKKEEKDILSKLYVWTER